MNVRYKAIAAFRRTISPLQNKPDARTTASAVRGGGTG